MASASSNQATSTMSELLYSFTLTAYRGPDFERPSWTSLRIKSLSTSGNPHIDKYVAAPLKPTRAEMQRGGSLGAPWIGMWCPTQDHEKKYKVRGLAVCNLTDVNPILPGRNDLRVVAWFGKDMSLNYYVLINQSRGGLCETMPIEGKEVFFFPEYRHDGQNSMTSRRDRWEWKIHTHLDLLVHGSTIPYPTVALRASNDDDDSIDQSLDAVEDYEEDTESEARLQILPTLEQVASSIRDRSTDILSGIQVAVKGIKVSQIPTLSQTEALVC